VRPVILRAAAILLLLSAPAEAVTCRVIDGDSLVCAGERVRLAGIDAPELRGMCRYERRLAERARAALEAAVDGQDVVLVGEGRDRYGRLLARVYVAGRDVGAALVAEGLARKWRGRREAWCW